METLVGGKSSVVQNQTILPIKVIKGLKKKKKNRHRQQKTTQRLPESTEVREGRTG